MPFSFVKNQIFKTNDVLIHLDKVVFIEFITVDKDAWKKGGCFVHFINGIRLTIGPEDTANLVKAIEKFHSEAE